MKEVYEIYLFRLRVLKSYAFLIEIKKMMN